MKNESANHFWRLWIAGVCAVAALACPSVHAAITTERVAQGLSLPLFATAPPGDTSRLFIVEQHSGDIEILQLGTLTLNATPFLTVGPLSTGSEQGLLGLAFHPSYASNGFFYVNFTDSGGTTRIRRYQVSANPQLANSGSGVDVLSISQPQSNHNGGWIAFGPDGFLYISSGDGGGSNDTGTGHTTGTGNAQDTGNLLGKLLRIDVNGDDFPADSTRNYAIPPSNPFVGVSGEDEIWAYGLRNPWRCSFDRLTGDLYIGDVGQNAREEIDVQPAPLTGGVNYGWRLREGMIATPSGGVGGAKPAGAIDPIYDYTHGSGTTQGFSVTGGYVYRGPLAALQGTYFFADYVTQRIWSLRFDGSAPAGFDGTNFSDFTDWTTALDPPSAAINSISSFAEDASGHLYIVDHGGEVFRIIDDSAPPTATASPTSGAPSPTATISATRTATGTATQTPPASPTPTVTVSPTPTSTPPPLPAGDHFLAYTVRINADGGRFYRFGPVTLQDQFRTAAYEVVKPTRLLLPADKNGEGVSDPNTHLEEYRLRRAAGSTAFAPISDVRVTTQCSDSIVRVSRPTSLLVPTNKDLGAPVAPPSSLLHDVDHFLCYRAKAQLLLSNGTPLPRFPRRIQVEVVDQFQSRRYDLKTITKLCNPVAKSGTPLFLNGPDKGSAKPIEPSVIGNPQLHLVCYAAVLSRRLVAQSGCGASDPADRGTAIEPRQERHLRRKAIHINNQFGPGQRDSVKQIELCLPAAKSLP